MSYANPRRLKRNKQQDLILESIVLGKASLRYIEIGDSEKAGEKAREAASLFFKADRLKRIRL